MSFLEKLFGRKSQTKKTVKPVREDDKLEYDFTTPGLSQRVTFGHNRDGEVAAVVLNIPEENIHKVIVNNKGHFENFPGIIRGEWTECIVGKFDFDAGVIGFRTSFENHESGYRCLWEIQPDGRYWADEDGFGIEDDDEIILYADLDRKGNFTGPFQIYTINGNKIEEKPKKEVTDKEEQNSQQDESSISNDEEHKFTNEEKNIFLVEHCAKELAENLEAPLKYSEPQGIALCYLRKDEPDDSNPKYIIVLEVSKDSEEGATFRLGVRRKYSDRLHSYYLSEAGKTQDEVKAWLENTEVCVPIILEYAEELSDKVDKG